MDRTSIVKKIIEVSYHKFSLFLNFLNFGNFGRKIKSKSMIKPKYTSTTERFNIYLTIQTKAYNLFVGL